MSTAAIGTIGTLGTGFIGGMGALGAMAKVLPLASGVTATGLPAEVTSTPSSTKVDISGAAKKAAAADGVPATQSMGELAQALIVALLLQMLEQRAVH